MKAHEVIAATGVTYKQLHHWTDRGWLQPRTHTRPGSGHCHNYPPHEVNVAHAMKRLTDAGLRVDIAANIARAAEFHHSYWLGDGIALLIDPPNAPAACHGNHASRLAS